MVVTLASRKSPPKAMSSSPGSLSLLVICPPLDQA
jgi:hypothetical protein